MPPVPAKVADRIANGIKKFQPVLAGAKSRDVGESDTVTIVVDILADVFGYDKYAEITSEYAIRGTYCDLATKIDGQLKMLIEVKAIGLDLKDAHVKQAVDYAANQGVDWVVLTNGLVWRGYKITFSKPIDSELVVQLDFSSLNPKNSKDVESLYLFAKEGWIKSVLGDYHDQKQALSRFFLGAVILSDPVVDVIRREIRRVSPDVRIESEEIRSVLVAEVLKREVIEGEKAQEAKKRVAKAATKALKARNERKSSKEEAPTDASESEQNQEAPGDTNTGDLIPPQVDESNSDSDLGGNHNGDDQASTAP